MLIWKGFCLGEQRIVINIVDFPSLSVHQTYVLPQRPSNQQGQMEHDGGGTHPILFMSTISKKYIVVEKAEVASCKLSSPLSCQTFILWMEENPAGKCLIFESKG